MATTNTAESTALGMPHIIKGQGIYAYAILKTSVEPPDEINDELIALVHKIAEKSADNLGDTSTLAGPRLLRFSSKEPD